MTQISCTVTDRSPSLVEVRCIGEVDVATRDQMATALVSVVTGSPRTCVVDMTSVAFIDSWGLQALVRCQDVLRSHGVVMTVRPGDRLSRLLELTGLAPRFRIAVEPIDAPLIPVSSRAARRLSVADAALRSHRDRRHHHALRTRR